MKMTTNKHISRYKILTLPFLLTISALLVACWNIATSGIVLLGHDHNRELRGDLVSSQPPRKEPAPSIQLQTMWDELESYSSSYETAPPRLITNFLIRRYQPEKEDDVDVEASIHVSTTETKLNNLKVCLDNWGGPASVAAHVSSEEEIQLLEAFIRKHKDGVLAKTNIHVFLERSFLPQKPWYPHNILRNLAMYNVVGNYFVALDVDLIPSRNSYPSIRALLESKADDGNNTTSVRELLKSRNVFVLPAFEVYAFNDNYRSFKNMIPKSRDDLLDMIKGTHPYAKAQMFHKNDWAACQRATHFPRWLAAAAASSSKNNNSAVAPRSHYEIRYEPDFEPYVLAYKPGIPRYWEAFRGYFFNKASWFVELDRAGYKFRVLSDSYVVHLNHRIGTNSHSEMKERNKPIFEEFLNNYLNHRYSKHNRTAEQGR
jgi:hypothetical protein